MRDTDLAWAAGFIDGEGCIQIRRGRNSGRWHYYTLGLDVAQLDPAPLLRLRDMFGGSVSLTRRGREDVIWKWQSSARIALAALEALLPYLTVKHEEAVLAIYYQQGKAGRGRLSDIGAANEVARNEEFKENLQAVRARRRAAVRAA